MYLTEVILGLRKLGVGRSLTASEIVNELDKYLFPAKFFFDDDGFRENKQEKLAREIFCEYSEAWFMPDIPHNHTMTVAETEFKTSSEYVEYIEEFHESKPWCKGFDAIGSQESDEEDLTQLNGIQSFITAVEIVKYLLHAELWFDDKGLLAARCAVSKFSPEFRIAGDCFKQVFFPTEFETLSLEIWADDDSYKFRDADCDEIAKRFCEVVMALSLNNFSLYLPTNMPPWQENKDFLQEIGILKTTSWDELAFDYDDIFSMVLNNDYLAESYDRWIRNFNEQYSPSKWAYYFWEQPFDASVWADSGFEPIEAALWNSIGYDTPDALAAFSHDWEYSSVAPIVRAGMAVTAQSVQLWGNAGNSSEILDAIDRGFPDIEEYQKYRTIDSFYSTIQKFLGHTKVQLSIQEISFAIELERSGMDIKDAIAWSKLEQKFSDVQAFILTKQSPARATKWIESGFQLDLAAQWVSIGLSVNDALLWTEQDFDTALASWFIERKIVSPREAKLWLKYIPKKEIENWHDAGFEPFSASDWREIGFGPEASLEWLSQGVETAKEAAKWNEGFFHHREALKEAAGWISRSISHENAQKWKAKGINPEIAERREQAGIKP